MWPTLANELAALPPAFPVLCGRRPAVSAALSALCRHFLGVPFNIASYALLLQMMAQVTGLKAGDFVHTTGDTHLYLNHLDQARLQLTRTPRQLPRMIINPEVKDLFDFKFEDFKLEGYDPWPHISAQVSV